MEDGFDPLLTRVEGSIDQFDAECLPLSYNCVAESVPEVLARDPVRVWDDSDEDTAALHLVDQCIDAFFEELWSRGNVVQGKVVADDIKLTLDSAYVPLDECGVNSKRFGALTSLVKRCGVWVYANEVTSNTLPLV